MDLFLISCLPWSSLSESVPTNSGPWLRFVPAQWSDTESDKVKKTLLSLGTTGMDNFKLESRLRNHQLTHNVELFLLFRAARTIGQPKRGRILHQLARIMRARNLVVPWKTFPLVSFPIMHDCYLLVGCQGPFLQFCSCPRSNKRRDRKNIEFTK